MADDKYIVKPDKKTENKKSYVINGIGIRRLWLILKCLFTTKSSDSILVTILLFMLCIGQQLIIYHIGLLPSNFFKVLGDKDKNELKPLLVRAFLLIFLISLCNSTIKLTCGHLYIMWREKLTNYIHKKYFSCFTVLYNINVEQNEIDNVDQRIGQDVERVCAQLRDLAPKLMISPLTIVYYSIQCFSATGYIGPVVIYAYFIVGTIVNKLIMSSIVNLVFNQEKREGDFRYWHTIVRLYAESISFLGGEKNEHENVSRFFRKLLSVQRQIINRELVLNFSTNLFDYIGSILSYIVISVSIFAGMYDDLTPVALSAIISRNSFVSMYLIYCFSTLIDMSASFTDIFAYSHRIGELVEYLSFCCCSKNSGDKSTEKLSNLDDKQLSIDELSYSPPNSSEELVTNLTLTLEKNTNLLITGKTGCGKSSLLRVILGLWRSTSGKVNLHISRQQLLFLPQKAFLTKGSLVDQVTYPSMKNNLTDKEKINHILEEVGLQTVIQRIGGIDVEPDWNWYDGLSPGEIQRLSFARVCYQMPSLAILDEPTSSLGLEEEKMLYNACSKRNINVITVGHRESLRQFHEMCLEIQGHGGKWSFYSL